MQVRKWAPKVKFHPNEQYLPSSVDYFLSQVNVKCHSGHSCANPNPLTASNLPQCSGQCYLDTKVGISCPSCTEPSVLKGQAPAAAPVYAIVNNHNKNNQKITDIYYWFWFPYNRGKSVCMGLYGNNYCAPVCGPFWGHCACPRINGCAGGYTTFGHHVGDWEHTIVRLIDDKVFYTLSNNLSH